MDKEDSWEKINKPKGNIIVDNIYNENGEINQIAKTKVNLNNFINCKTNSTNWNQCLYYAEEKEGYIKKGGIEGRREGDERKI